MKEVKKKTYIVATFEPMNKAPRVLSNEGKDMSYSLWVSQNHEWSLARIYIKHGGNYTEEYVKTVYSRASFGYFKSRKENGLLKPPKCESRQNVFRLFVGYDGRFLVHQKRPEKRGDIEKTKKNKIQGSTDSDMSKQLELPAARSWDTNFRDDETWDGHRTWDLEPALTLSKSVKKSGFDNRSRKTPSGRYFLPTRPARLFIREMTWLLPNNRLASSLCLQQFSK